MNRQTGATGVRERTRGGKMSQSFSTDLVPVSDRLEAWLCNAKPTCGDCRFHFPRCLPFHGSIVITQLEGMRQYCQSGAMAFLTAGDTTLIDSGRPWTSDCAGDCIRLYL